MANNSQDKRSICIRDDANTLSCPNCYESFDYSSHPDGGLVPRLLDCGHLVCFNCAVDLLTEGSLCCPTCCERKECTSAADLPVPECTPVSTPLSSPVSSPVPRHSGSNASFDGMPVGSRLTSFLSSGAGSSLPGAVSFMADDDEGGTPAQLVCMVKGCGELRREKRYFCDKHQDKARRVSWKSANRMVDQYKDVSHYRLKTIGTDGGLKGAEIKAQDRAPSLESLRPARLAELFQHQDTITMGEALFLIDEAVKVLNVEKNTVYLKAPLHIVGDLHGQFFDLLSLLDAHGGGPEEMSGEAGTSPPTFLFLGDYVDRGSFSCEVLLYLLALKLAAPNSVHLLRGNHECRSLTAHFGFKDECKVKYGLPVYYRFVKCFESMPLCALVESGKSGKEGKYKYFCTHGGISPHFQKLDQINQLDRRAEPEMDGALCDLLWADPSDDRSLLAKELKDLTGSEVEALLAGTYAPNALRGCSVSFGYAAAVEFCQANDIDCIIRAHAVQEEGYYRHFEAAQELQKQQGGGGPAAQKPPLVMTVFSAPNYCSRFGNRAAILTLQDDVLEPVVSQYQCVPHPETRQQENSSEVHLSALIEACPYMPTTFRGFVMWAGIMGPAQPLAQEGDNGVSPAPTDPATPSPAPRPSQSSVSRAGSSTGGGWLGNSLTKQGMTSHDKYKIEAQHDRINERHPEIVRQKLKGANDEEVSCLGAHPSATVNLEGSRSVNEIRAEYERRNSLVASETRRRSFSQTQAAAAAQTPGNHAPAVGDKAGVVNPDSHNSKVRTSTSTVPPKRVPPPVALAVNVPSSQEALQRNQCKEEGSYIASRSKPPAEIKPVQAKSAVALRFLRNIGGGEDSSKPADVESPASRDQQLPQSPSYLAGSNHTKEPPPPPPLSARRSMPIIASEDECEFTQVEILGLKLLFALMDHAGQDFIDATSLELFALEHNDFAQQREIEACIEAMDIDDDKRIGLMDFISFAVRLKFFSQAGTEEQEEIRKQEQEQLEDVGNAESFPMPDYDLERLLSDTFDDLKKREPGSPTEGLRISNPGGSPGAATE